MSIINGILNSGKYHVVTFAESYSSMLDIYSDYFVIDRDTIEKIVREVNERDEVGSLYPKASISIIPRRYVRDLDNANALAVQLIEFLRVNREIIRSGKILFDFRLGRKSFILEACKEALNSEYAINIKEIVIVVNDDYQHCRSELICCKSWQRLSNTVNPIIRYCNDCHRQIYLCENNDDLVNYIRLNQCMSINYKFDSSMILPFFIASFHGRLEIVQDLLGCGIDINVSNIPGWDGWTALMAASRNGHIKIVNFLLKCGARVDLFNNERIGFMRDCTALMLASNNSHTPVVKTLLDHGANPNATSLNGWTALMMAANSWRSSEILEILLKSGADVNIVNKCSWTALMLASAQHSIENLKVLLKYGADVNTASDDSWTALMVASKKGLKDNIEILLAHRAEVNTSTNRDHLTALIASSKRGHMDAVNALLKYQANVNAATIDGWTALMFASKKGHTNVVSTLLNYGANMSLVNKNNETAIDIALRNRNINTLKTLLNFYLKKQNINFS